MLLHPQQVYKQKVKHLLYEHQNNITSLKADGELALKLQQDDFRKREGELGRDKRGQKLEIKEMVRDSSILSLPLAPQPVHNAYCAAGRLQGVCSR